MRDAPPLATFASHRGVVPILWVLASLCGIELVVVHLVFVLRWPHVAWPLSILTALSLVWMISWIRSWARLPHELYPDRLRLHFGSLRHFDVPLATIIAFTSVVSDERMKRHHARNLVPIAYPNRLILLSEPVSRRCNRGFAIRLDDPLAFDAALARVGIPMAAA